MKYQKAIIIVVVPLCVMISFISGVYVGKTKDIPFVKRQSEWSIGIYVGKGPFNFVSPGNIANPVLTAEDVTDVPADFVADPFMVKEGSTWYMFFEVLNRHTDQGDIGMAISNDGLDWTYRQIILDESFHLSYPYVFKWKNEYYMIPEACQTKSIRLYKANDFPYSWSLGKILLKGRDFVDNTIFNYNNMWWLFTETGDNDVLRLYYAEDLMGPWIEHPKSPIIIKNANIARPGGRVLIFNDQIIRYTQDDEPTYGNQVRAFEITELTTTSYKEKEMKGSPVLKATGFGWNRNGMHHIDAHQIEHDKWIACVDGYRRIFVFGGKK